MKKVLLVLAIVGIFLMPMIPVKAAIWEGLPPGVNPPQQKCDIIFAKGKGLYPKPPGIPEWHHACVYIGIGKVIREDKTVRSWRIVQSDPHYEKWDSVAKSLFFSRQWVALEIYLENRGIGGVEYETVPYIFKWYKDKVHYGRVNDANEHEDKILSFLEDRATHPKYAPIRPFDFKSYWQLGPGSKQVDGPPKPPWHPNSRGWRYYCAELVWAAYWDAMGINLDYNTNGRVQPREIYYSLHYGTHGYIYDKYNYPWP